MAPTAEDGSDDAAEEASVGLIAGGAVGVIVVLGALYFFLFRKKPTMSAKIAVEPTVDDPPAGVNAPVRGGGARIAPMEALPPATAAPPAAAPPAATTESAEERAQAASATLLAQPAGGLGAPPAGRRPSALGAGSLAPISQEAAPPLR